MAKTPGTFAGKIGDSSYYFAASGKIVDENGKPVPEALETVIKASVPTPTEAVKKQKKSLREIAGKIGNSKYYFQPDGTIIDENGKAANQKIQEIFSRREQIEKGLPRANTPPSKDNQESNKIEKSFTQSIAAVSKVVSAQEVYNSKVSTVLDGMFNIVKTISDQNDIILRKMIQQNEEFRDKVVEQLTGVKGPSKASGAVSRPRRGPPAVGASRAGKAAAVQTKVAKAVAAPATKYRETRRAEVEARAARIAGIRAKRNVAVSTAAAVGGAAIGAGVIAAGLGMGRGAAPSAPSGAAPGGGAAPGPTGTMPSSGAQPSSIPGMVTLTTPISKRQYVVAEQYANNFKGFVDELENSGYQIKSIGGYANRNIAGTGQKSFHSLGVAIDINPSSNPHLFDGRTVTDMPSNVSAMARKYGLGWGGDWRSSKDTMHFSMADKEGGSVAVDRSGVSPLPGAPATPGTTEMAARAGAPTTEAPPQPGVVPGAPMPAPAPAPPAIGTGGVGALAGPGGQTPVSPDGGGSESALLGAAMSAGITDKVELAQFMAQMAHESGNFRYLQEIWGPTAAQQRYEGRRDLGNTEPGDGYRFRGRGYVQLTGRANYATYGSMIGVDLVNNPELASQPDIAAKLAVAYWNSRVKPRIQDFQDTRAVTRIINGGYNGLDDRISKFAKYSNQPDLGAGVAVAAATPGAMPGAPTVAAPEGPSPAPAPGEPRPAAAPEGPTTGTGGVGALAGPGGQTPVSTGAAGKPSNVTFGPNTDVSKVDPDLLQRFYQAAAEYGRPVTINSAYRGDEYQAQLWVRANVFREPGIFSPAKPEKTMTITYKGQQYTVPGSGKGSAHGRGQALDVSPGPELDPFLQKYGLNRPHASFDPPHVQKIGGSDFVPDTSPEGTKMAGGPPPTPPAAGQPQVAGAPPAAAAAAPRPSAPSRPSVAQQPQPQIAAMSQQAAMQDFFGAMMGVQPIIMNNTRMINNNRTIYQQSSFSGMGGGRSSEFNPLVVAGAAAGFGIAKALRLF